jgi:Bacteriocin-protection, YdeI or OmpD-Associated
MPGNVRDALTKRKLMDAFRARPDYQQNDYLKWLATANGVATKQQRLDQMLDELQNGGLFKGEKWTAPAPTAPKVRAPDRQ